MKIAAETQGAHAQTLISESGLKRHITRYGYPSNQRVYGVSRVDPETGHPREGLFTVQIAEEEGRGHAKVLSVVETTNGIVKGQQVMRAVKKLMRYYKMNRSDRSIVISELTSFVTTG